MGMYTQVELEVMLKRDTPQEIIHFIEVMTNGPWDLRDAVAQKKPDHKFFQADRWGNLFFGMYSGFERPTGSFIALDNDERLRLVIQAELKNYDAEVSRFLDWIKPYVEPQEEPVGWHKYEEYEEPELIYFKDEQ